MKKVIISALVMVALMIDITDSFAGLKDMLDRGVKGQRIGNLILSAKSFNNTVCTDVAALESETGIDLKTVTDNQVQNYFSGATLSQAEIDFIQAAMVSLDKMCEIIATEAPKLPATDN